MAASDVGLVVCCSVVFWVLLCPTTFQVTAAPFSKTAEITQSESHFDASGHLDRDIVWHRRKKRYKNYPVAEHPRGYDWDNKQFPGQNDYHRNKIGPRYQYDPSGYRGENSYHEYPDGRDSRYEEFRKSQLWEPRGPNSPDSYNRRIEVPHRKVQPDKILDTGSSTLYQPKRIGVPKHVAGFWGDSPDGDSPTIREKGILQTLAKAERSGFHKIKPGSVQKVSTQYDFTDKAARRQDGRYPEGQARYPFEYDRHKSRDQPKYQDPPDQSPQSQYQPPNESPGLSIRVNHPKIGSMLGQNEQGLKKGVPLDGMLLNLHEAPSVIPVPKAHKSEPAGQAAHEAPHQDSAQQPASTNVALNTTEKQSEKEFEVPMPPKSKAWLEMHPEEIQGPSTSPTPTSKAAPTTSTLAIPMPPKSKVWLEQQRLQEEMARMEEEKKEIERLGEESHRLDTNQTLGTSGGGNSSRYVTEEEQPAVDKEAVVEDTGGAVDDSRVYLTREEYERLQLQARLEQQRESMMAEQREQEAHLRAESKVEDKDKSTNQVHEDRPAESQVEDKDTPTDQVQDRPAESQVEDKDTPTDQVQEDRPAGSQVEDKDKSTNQVHEDRPTEPQVEDKDKSTNQVHEDRLAESQVEDKDKSTNQVHEDRPTESQVEDKDKSTNQVHEDRLAESQVEDKDKSTNQVHEDRPAESQVEDKDTPTDQVQEDTHDKVVNKTVDAPETIKRDPPPEEIEQLRQAELEREREAMLEELEEEKSKITSEIKQSNGTQTVSQVEEDSHQVTADNTGSKNESLKQEEGTNARESELEKEREQMLDELNKEEGVLLGSDQSGAKTEDEGLQSLAEVWEKMNPQKSRRKRRSLSDQHSVHRAASNGNFASSGSAGEAGGSVNKGVAGKNDIVVDGERIAMPPKRGNSYLKKAGKYESFPAHVVKTERLGVPKSVAGFWEDTKGDDDIAADKKPSSSSSHMKVTLNKANPAKNKASAADTLHSNLQNLKDANFYKSKGIDRLAKYKKTPFEDVGPPSPFKDNPKPQSETLPVHHKYPVPPVQSSLPAKQNAETSGKVAPEKIVSFEKGVDDVPVPMSRQKVTVHNSVPHPSKHVPEYTSDQILAEKKKVLQDTLAQKVALAKSHAASNYQKDHAYVQGTQLVKSPDKLANQSSSSNQTDIAYQFFNPEFYNNIMARYKSKDALWAALCLAIVLFVMFAAVWYSKMWRKKGGDWDLPGKYQPEATSIPIKELIRQKLGRFPRLKLKSKRKRKGPIGHRYLQLKRKQSTGATSSDEEVMYKRL